MTDDTVVFGWNQPFSRISRRISWGVLTRSLSVFIAPALFANAAPWMASNVNTAVLPSGFKVAQAVFSPDGNVIAATSEYFVPAGACQAPTLVWGNPSQTSSCIGKFTPSGSPVFITEIGGAGIGSIVLDGAGDIYITGQAGPAGAGFATTPGVYQPNPPGAPDPFLCKFSGTDGHAIFCTFVDTGEALAIDSDGNSYLAGLTGAQGLSVEKINATATAVDYLTGPLNIPSQTTVVQSAVALDANGNLYCLCEGLAELNPAGALVASVDPGNEEAYGLALDSSGNPELLLGTTPGNFDLRKYSAGLASILFDTAFYAGASPYAGDGSYVLSLAVDTSGVADIIGYTPAVNLGQVNPAQQCALTGTPSTLNTLLVRIDASGNIQESSYLDNVPGVPSGAVQETVGSSSPGAAVLFWSEYYNTTTIFTLSPASAPIALGCIGNAASFVNMGLAPNEIVSAFGDGIGPTVPAIAQPDSNGLYPTQLGGIEITFDGVAAPLLYASSSQVNLITPQALNGKTSTQICAVLNNVPLNCITAAVQAAAPGIFMSGQLYVGMFYGGTPYAAAVNQDGTINSQQNPAAPNSILALYVTGLGAMTPSPPDGGITPVPEPSQDWQINVVFFAYNFDGGISLVVHPNVLYAGPAPLEVEGLGQINVQVPQNAFEFSISVVSPDGTQQYNSGNAVIWVQSQ